MVARCSDSDEDHFADVFKKIFRHQIFRHFSTEIFETLPHRVALAFILFYFFLDLGLHLASQSQVGAGRRLFGDLSA